jgi:hypothetical protein
MKWMIIAAILSMMIAGCKGCKGEQPVLMVVLCDVSHSSTLMKSDKEKNLELLIAQVKSIPGKLPRKSVVFYLPISANRYAMSIGDVVEKRSVNDSKRAKEDARFKQLIDSVCNSLRKLATTDSASSCILTSIENGYHFLLDKHSDYSGHDMQLMIISDMLESCTTSAGRMRMQSLEGKLLDSTRWAVAAYKSHMRFDAQQISINVKLLTPGMNSKLSEVVTGYWDTLFRKMGYQQKTVTFDTPTL